MVSAKSRLIPLVSVLFEFLKQARLLALTQACVTGLFFEQTNEKICRAWLSLPLTGAVKNRLTPDGSTCGSLILNLARNLSLGVDDGFMFIFRASFPNPPFRVAPICDFFFFWSIFFVNPIQTQLFGTSQLVNKPLTQVPNCYLTWFFNF